MTVNLATSYWTYFLRSYDFLVLINNIITNTRLPISDTINNTDTTPSPAEQPSDDEEDDKQNDGHDVGDDDGRLVNNTIEDDCELEHSLGTEKYSIT